MKTIALEALAFQGTAFFDALTKAMGRLRQAVRSSDYMVEPCELDEGKALGEVIRKHTNLNVTLMPNPDGIQAAIMCPRLVNGHIFDSVYGWNNAAETEWSKDARDLLSKYKNGFAPGLVDIRKNRVEGIFAEIPYQLYIKRSFLSGEQLSDSELTAVILHEVGHAFTQCEYINRTATTNQVLADVLASKNAGQETQISTLIVRLASQEHLTEKQKDALLTCKKPEDYVVMAYAVTDEKCRSELGYSVYDSVSSEQLADLYAARCGAGRYVVTGLDKLHQTDFGGYNRSCKMVRIARGFFSFALLNTYLSGLGGVGAAVAFGMPLLGLLTGITLSMVLTASLIQGTVVGVDYAVYDDPVVRFDRIKQQLVQQLKEPGLSRKITQTVLSDIAEIDKIVEPLRKSVGTHHEGQWTHYVALLFSSLYRRKIDVRALQQQLEALASNNLFVQAAKFKTV